MEFIRVVMVEFESVAMVGVGNGGSVWVFKSIGQVLLICDKIGSFPFWFQFSQEWCLNYILIEFDPVSNLQQFHKMFWLIMVSFLSILCFFDEFAGLCIDFLYSGELLVSIWLGADFLYLLILIIIGLPEFVAMQQLHGWEFGGFMDWYPGHVDGALKIVIPVSFLWQCDFW